MNIIFERKVVRLGLMASWPQVPPGKGFFAGMARVVYGELKSQPKYELIPSVTYSNIWDRESPEKWSRGDDATEVGITAKYGLGRDNYLGAIFTNRNFADGYNRAFGSDIYLRLGKGNHFLRANYLYTTSKNPSTQEKSNGSTVTASYEFHSKPFDLMTSYEYFDKDFRMDTAFIRRRGMSKFTSYMTLNFYPDRKKTPWLNRITPFAFGYYLHDLFTGEDDYLYNVGIKFNFPKNANYRLEYKTFREYWVGQTFKGSFLDTFGGIQLFNWLNLYAFFQVGDGIYYDPTAPLMGKGISFDFQTTIQPNDKITQFFQYYYQKLERKSDGEKLYDVNILNSNTTYQVNRYLFLRAVFQYDSYLKTLLTDALISFELIPGTVLHLGYGSLREKLHWSEIDNRWFGYGPMMKYYKTRQSLFFKASYRFKF